MKISLKDIKDIKNLDLTSDAPLSQLIRYGMVGVLNTLVTLIVIFFCKSIFGINDYVSNLLGYVAGILNSFIWNRQWVFHSEGKVHKDMIMFFIGCGVCYLIQLLVVWLINQSWFGDTEYDLGFFVISGYGIATLVGMVVYTICNFIYNRTIAFTNAGE